MSADAVDGFLRRGRIGPAMLGSHNMHSGTTIPLSACTFGARRDADGYAEVVMTLPSGEEVATRVGRLYVILSGPGDITHEEAAFFRSLDINYQ